MVQKRDKNGGIYFTIGERGKSAEWQSGKFFNRPTDVATDGSDLESWPEWDKFNCLHESIYSNKGHCIDENYKFGLSFDKNDIGTYINIQHLCNNIHVGDDEPQYHHGKYECFAAPDEFCVE